MGSEVALLSDVLFVQLGGEVVLDSKLMPDRSVDLNKPGESITSLVAPPETEETLVISAFIYVLEVESFFPIQESDVALASVVRVLSPGPWEVGSGVLTV